MTQEDKDLLFRDLCGRLPYGVKGNYQNSDDELLRKVTIMYRYLEPNGMVMTGDIKPYLFPFSSMTEGHREEINKITNGSVAISKNFFYDLCNCSKIYHFDVIAVIDWLNKKHFDYRGLIEKSLAIDATGLNIYNEEAKIKI